MNMKLRGTTPVGSIFILLWLGLKLYMPYSHTVVYLHSCNTWAKPEGASNNWSQCCVQGTLYIWCQLKELKLFIQHAYCTMTAWLISKSAFGRKTAKSFICASHGYPLKTWSCIYAHGKYDGVNHASTLTITLFRESKRNSTVEGSKFKFQKAYGKSGAAKAAPAVLLPTALCHCLGIRFKSRSETAFVYFIWTAMHIDVSGTLFV